MCSSLRAATALATALFAAAAPGQAVSAAEAARLAFAGCQVEREVLELAPADREKLQERAAVRSIGKSVVRFVARRGGELEGTAYVDTRRVRTKAQQLLVVLDRAGKVRRIEVLAWMEPQRYRPRPRFFSQFRGKGLDETLRLRRGIRPVTGATMSARAAVDAVRTVLAVHERHAIR